MQSSADVLRADQATTERVKVLVPFGLTERQVRFLATVMFHSGVFVGRQYAAFAGITHGQKIHDFIEKLVTQRLVTPIRLGSSARTRIFHAHHKPLYAAIGEPDNRNRRRVTIDRAIERLMVLDGVLADRSVTWLGSEREKRRYFKQHLGDHLRDDEYPRLVFGKRPNVTVRYFPDKLPIGYDRDHRRYVFMYLARSPSAMDFRVFILRHLELLNALGFWTIRVIFPRSLARSMEAYRKAAHELLAKALTQKVMQVMVRRVARRANVKPGLHILRHSFCSHLAMRGAPARAIQELAGHQDLARRSVTCTSARRRSTRRFVCWRQAQKRCVPSWRNSGGGGNGGLKELSSHCGWLANRSA